MTAFKRSQAKYVKHAYQTTNWPEYEAGLRQRGSQRRCQRHMRKIDFGCYVLFRKLANLNPFRIPSPPHGCPANRCSG